MANYTNNKKSLGLKGGPNEYLTHISDLFSIDGYKADSPDVNNPYNIIQSGNITMEGVDFPVMGTDNLGNSKLMTPGNNYQFPGDQVFEMPLAQDGNETTSAKQFSEQYIQSPKYLKRLKSSGYENPKDVIQSRLAPTSLTKEHVQESSPSVMGQLYNKFNNVPYSIHGSAYRPNVPPYGNMILDRKESEQYKTPLQQIAAHEYGHAALSTTTLNEYDKNQILSRLNNNKRNDHDSKFDENYSDLNALRYNLYENFGVDVMNKNITIEDIQTLKKEGVGFSTKRLFENYSEEDLLWMLNNIASNDVDNNINDESSLPQAQLGTFIKKGIKKLPGLIDDGAKYLDNFFSSSVKSPSIINKSNFDIDKFNITIDDIKKLGATTKERLLTDKFIENNMKATSRSREEVISSINTFSKEFDNATITFNDLGKNGANAEYSGKGNIQVNSSKLNEYTNKTQVLGDIEHEIEHLFSDFNGRYMTLGENTVRYPAEELYKNYPSLKVSDSITGTIPGQTTKGYLELPFEQQVRYRKAIAWLEENAGLKTGDDITNEHIDKLSMGMQNWARELGEDFSGKGGRTDVLKLMTSLDPRQFLKEGQVALGKNANIGIRVLKMS